MRSACLVSLVALAAVGAAHAQTPLPAGTIRVQRMDIIDQNGFERPMVASTVFVPSGWVAQGGVVWNLQNPCGMGYNVDFQAMSPDGRIGVHFFPMEQWQWNTTGMPATPGCPTVQITSVQQYLGNLVQRMRPGARMLDFRPRPDIAQELQALNSVTPMPLGEMRAWVEAGEALIAYDQNGVDMRETVMVAAVFNLMRMVGMAGMPPMDYLSGATLPGFAMRAPNGQLDFQIAEMIRRSVKENPQWMARISQHNANIASINVQGARDRSQIIAQTGEEIRRMQADSWRLSSESFDRNSRETSEMIRGVETFNDPYHGGTVELDNTFNYHWQLQNGDYVLTNDANFNPAQYFNLSGQLLERTP